MAQQISPSALADLQDQVREWCQQHVQPHSVAEAEELAQAITRQLAQTIVETGVQKLAGRASYLGTRQPCPCGGKARFLDYRPRWLHTVCGEVKVKRAYYHCAGCGCGASPWDRQQGLNRRVWTPAAKALVNEVCVRVSYGEGTQLLERMVGLRIEESSAQDLVHEIGERLRAEEDADLEACFERYEPVAAEAEPERLYISMDAAKAHTEGAWHDVKVGAVYEGRRGPKGFDEAHRLRYVARQEEAEWFGRRVYLRALRSGLEQAGQVVVLGDGASWIWNLAAEHFPECIEILDYYHACEHVWALARVLYGEGNPTGKRWAKGHCRTLKKHGPESFLRALRRRKPDTPEQAEALRLESGYFETNEHRMRYRQFREQGMMIGSGPVEAGCKVVVGQRLKRAGMRWTQAGADAVLAVRTAVLNEEYDRVARLAHAA